LEKIEPEPGRPPGDEGEGLCRGEAPGFGEVGAPNRLLVGEVIYRPPVNSNSRSPPAVLSEGTVVEPPPVAPSAELAAEILPPPPSAVFGLPLLTMF